jgi:hypothetical protein
MSALHAQPAAVGGTAAAGNHPMNSTKLNKLVAHEKSAREIGSIAEADVFAAKINQVKGKADERAKRRSKVLRRSVLTKRVKQTEEEIVNLQRRLGWLKSRLGQL